MRQVDGWDNEMNKQNRFLGRYFDEKTLTWSFKDGSGTIPDEMRIDVIESIREKDGSSLGVLFSWKDRFKQRIIN